MKSSGIELWLKARKIIPGGNQLLSKRPERYLPGLWPSYYSKAKGCEVWDLDGKHYYDFAQMGVGSCVLGYADEDVNAAVMEAIVKGSMCTLNCPEEVEFAEQLVALHPWAEMVRFARTGGEACSIAVRIGRAASGRSKVAFCGYHGWHDWYLSSNLGDEASLDEQLMPGLKPAGVPRELTGTSLAFRFNQIEELEEIERRHGRDVGVIIMEPQRGTVPEKDFLRKVREVANRLGAVLIFDEVTSGFRMNLGGIHLTMGVEPDIAVFGKALGNGYPISAVVGRRGVMDSAQNTFISSTFWTERIGFAAAIATLKKMRERNVQGDLVRYGEMINAGWTRLAEKHGLSIHISGIPPLTHVSFVAGAPLMVQTLYAQEMLERGYLLGSSVYATSAYSDEIIGGFLEHSDDVFGLLRNAVDSGDIKKYLKGEVLNVGFKRLA